MKKLFLLPLFGLTACLSACSGQYLHTTEPRSVVYMGQPAADLYENFGVPTKIKRLEPNVQVLIYQKQDIEKDWAYRYLHTCEMQFYMVDDRVADWFSTGDMCSIKSSKSSGNDWDYRDGGLLSFMDENPLYQEVSSGGYGYFSEQVPNDAFSSSDFLKWNVHQSQYMPSDAFNGAKEVRRNGWFSSSKEEDDYGIFDAPRQPKSMGMYGIPADAF